LEAKHIDIPSPSRGSDQSPAAGARGIPRRHQEKVHIKIIRKFFVCHSQSATIVNVPDLIIEQDCTFSIYIYIYSKHPTILFANIDITHINSINVTDKKHNYKLIL
jgi:hypothetical protein